MSNLKWQLKQLELTADYLYTTKNVAAIWANMREIERIRLRIWREENKHDSEN